MKASYQKPYLQHDLPVDVFVSDIIEFPHHWHDYYEILYCQGDGLKVGLNNEVLTMNDKDILIIGSGEIHYFPLIQQQVSRIVVSFEAAFFEGYTSLMKNKRVNALIRANLTYKEQPENSELHTIFEKYLLEIIAEYREKRKGYKIALKARLSDILLIMIRQLPHETYSAYEKNRQLNRLERLEQVFNFVEQNYERELSLSEIATTANYSIFHFTRFFKEATSMTFNQYINNFRISKASQYLMQSGDPIIDIAYKSGFSSIKTFNRVFRHSMGCSPSEYRKTMSEN